MRFKLLQLFSAEPTRLWLDGVPGVVFLDGLLSKMLRFLDHLQTMTDQPSARLTQLEHMDTGQVQLMLHSEQ